VAGLSPAEGLGRDTQHQPPRPANQARGRARRAAPRRVRPGSRAGGCPGVRPRLLPHTKSEATSPARGAAFTPGPSDPRASCNPHAPPPGVAPLPGREGEGGRAAARRRGRAGRRRSVASGRLLAPWQRRRILTRVNPAIHIHNQTHTHIHTERGPSPVE
jgi:hypothetical protein